MALRQPRHIMDHYNYKSELPEKCGETFPSLILKICDKYSVGCTEKSVHGFT
jgi:hypothetical protein